MTQQHKNMRKNILYGLTLLAGLFFTSFNPANSQVLQVTSDITPEEMVEILIGSGLSYDNVVFTGADTSRGSFWGGPGNIGLSHGIILTSGDVDLAPGPNLQSGAGVANMTPGDPDLEMLSQGGMSYDACVLEFDFVPFYEYVWFQFVFCSEEYPEFVGSPFNDVFGFFISGPGITGPYSNNSKNIALIPNTEIPVSINNVNQDINSDYYVVNDSNFIQYDGFTTVLTAESEVEPMNTYHIKLAIGDIADAVFDSGVLLQASSFCSGPVAGVGKGDTQKKNDNYQIYPVPAGDELSIASLSGKTFRVQLVGQDGRSCMSASGKSQITLDISSLPPGIYFLRITDNDGVTTRKIFKK
jgi:hypothetical protein